MKEMNILVSSAGRRLELIQCLRDALRDNAVQGAVCAVDYSLDAPSIHLADRAWQVPSCKDPSFIPALLALALRENIRIIVPTIDPELALFAANRHLFAKYEIDVCISRQETVLICEDKVATHQWLQVNGFPTVRQSTPIDVLNQPGCWNYPLIVKPRRGSASKGVRYVRTAEELHTCAMLDDDLIVQSIAEGNEHTINVYLDRDGKCVCAVPHRRLEVRGGEVSKGVTVKNRQMMDLGREIAEALPGAYGPMNIQCFLSPYGQIRVIEINCRLGGGYPLAHRAGARFTHWMVEEALGRNVSGTFDGWEDDLAMLRYDQAVFQPGVNIRPQTAAPSALSGVGSG